MNDEELIKSCPFCGSEAMGVVNSADEVLICCSNVACHSMQYNYLPHEQAIESWNRRV